ncbi:MAG TPA: L,D-transpeptidase [Solirubrobacteraceae bacterium]|jgi:lipoprotein-anchoring transpeptidase ErfK/SrfK|nr:L,D-transpeptidase [Solirubrobacteraceae bacterium]
MSASRGSLLGRRLALGLAGACLAVAVLGSASDVASAGTARAGTATARAALAPPVQVTQELVVLASAHGAHSAPEAGSAQVALVAASRPITGEATTLPVIARSIAANGARWLLVLLPGRPNGASGWIAEHGTRPSVTSWSIVVDLAARRLRVYNDARVVKAFRAIVGKPSTPTPAGRFFVEESLQMPAGEPGGPFALALSARSDVLQEFEGGPGQIAIHGRDNLGGTLGTAASHGCIRLASAGIDWLASRIGPGTPVTIDAR